MSVYDHHLCFVSGQNVPELLGALAPQCSTSHMHALITPEMGTNGISFGKSCQRENLRFSIHSLEKAKPDSVKKALDTILETCKHEKIALNISGGTKLMAIAAFQWASEHNIDVLYVDTLGRKIQLYKNGTWSESPLPELLNHEAILNLYGYEINSVKHNELSKATHKALNSFVQTISKAAGSEAIKALNAVSNKASSSSSLNASYTNTPLFAELLGICKNAGLLTYDAKSVTFSDEEARKWCNGLWLEEYVQLVLTGLLAEKRIFSFACGLQVVGNSIKNELDQVFAVNNRLYVIECKSSLTKASGTGSNKTQSVLYKQDSLAERLGGIFTSSMICSAEPLTDYGKNHAKNFGIKCVTGPQLLNLRQHILDWIK